MFLSTEQGSEGTSGMPNRVFVVGVGMTKFEKPGRREGWDYPDMAQGVRHQGARGRRHRLRRGRAGLTSATCTASRRRASARSTSSGMTGIPIVNVNNNCSTGSTALYLAAQAIRGGLADCAIALGFEKMQPGSLGGDVRRPRASRWTRTSWRWPRSPRSRSRRRRGCSAPPGREHMKQVRHHRRAFREDRLQEPQALGEQPVRAVPGRVHARRHPGVAG